MAIRQLSETLINQIAAGEVIERPASAAKELIENSIDAGATRIEIATAGGGKALLRVSDNGGGMNHADLELAVRRHCTSKISETLDDIRTLGFRGEALPSIASVARLSIASRRMDGAGGAEIVVAGGKVLHFRPAAANAGTIVEVRDLFFATPARLKFLKTEKAEAAAITEVVKRMAIAFPHVRFVLSGSDRATLEFASTGDDHLARIAQVLGRDFKDNAIELDATREDVRLTGLPAFQPSTAETPPINMPSSTAGRCRISRFSRRSGAPMRRRSRPGAIPSPCLSIKLDPALVDVNVHPAKSDVRFRDPGLVRGLIVGAIREALARDGDRASTTGADGMMRAFRAGFHPGYRPAAAGGIWSAETSPSRPYQYDGATASGFAERPQASFDGLTMPTARNQTAPRSSPRTQPRGSNFRWGQHVRRSTKTTSSPKPRTGLSSSTSTRPTSGWYSRKCARRCTPNECRRRCC